MPPFEPTGVHYDPVYLGVDSVRVNRVVQCTLVVYTMNLYT